MDKTRSQRHQLNTLLLPAVATATTTQGSKHGKENGIKKHASPSPLRQIKTPPLGAERRCCNGWSTLCDRKWTTQYGHESSSCSLWNPLVFPVMLPPPRPRANVIKSGKATTKPVTSVATRRICIGILSDVIRKKPTPLPTAKPNDRHFTCCLIFIDFLAVPNQSVSASIAPSLMRYSAQHSYKDRHHPRHCPLPRASRGVACWRLGRRGGRVDGG